MKIIKNVVIAFVALLVVAALGSLLIPRISKVERSLVIQAPAEVIFDQVNNLQKADAWSPWKDPTMKISFGPVIEGKGASTSWESEKMGKGTQTIEESVPSSSIVIGLDFGAMGTAKALWSFAPEGEGVKVTETLTSDAGMNPVKRLMSLTSDKMMGPYFEKGLASLKQVSETRAAEIQAEQAATMQASAGPAEAGSSAAPAAATAPGAAPAAAPTTPTAPAAPAGKAP